jgi:integrase
MVESISGPDRAMMYVLAAWTGFRKGEIGSLTLRSLHLDDDPPTATVDACYSKRRREDTQVLHPEVARQLKA